MNNHRPTDSERVVSPQRSEASSFTRDGLGVLGNTRSSTVQDAAGNNHEKVTDFLKASKETMVGESAEAIATYEETFNVPSLKEDGEMTTSATSSLTRMTKAKKNGHSIAEIEQELKIDEEEAEIEDAAEDAELEAEGFVDGTEPIEENDEMEGVIEPVEEGQQTTPAGSNGNSSDVNVQADLELWKEMEEWKDATEAFAAENNKDSNTKIITEEDIDKATVVWEKNHGMNDNGSENTAVNEEGGQEGDTDDDSQFAISPSPAPAVKKPHSAPTISDHTSPVSTYTHPPGVPNHDPDSPTATFSPSPTGVIAGAVDCSGIVGHVNCAFIEHPLVIVAVALFAPLLLMYCLRKYCLSLKSNDTRGEYRAVAAKYGEMGYDNTFSDALSDDEDDDYMNGNGDVEEDDSWGKSGKKTLEMPRLGKERNGGLSLEEING